MYFKRLAQFAFITVLSSPLAAMDAPAFDPVTEIVEIQQQWLELSHDDQEILSNVFERLSIEFPAGTPLHETSILEIFPAFARKATTSDRKSWCKKIINAPANFFTGIRDQSGFNLIYRNPHIWENTHTLPSQIIGDLYIPAENQSQARDLMANLGVVELFYVKDLFRLCNDDRPNMPGEYDLQVLCDFVHKSWPEIPVPSLIESLRELDNRYDLPVGFIYSMLPSLTAVMTTTKTPPVEWVTRIFETVFYNPSPEAIQEIAKTQTWDDAAQLSFLFIRDGDAKRREALHERLDEITAMKKLKTEQKQLQQRIDSTNAALLELNRMVKSNL